MIYGENRGCGGLKLYSSMYIAKNLRIGGLCVLPSLTW
jgi:hypothetical protein